jgi:RNA polymerase sigma-70 factor (ECF subfamily)
VFIGEAASNKPKGVQNLTDKEIIAMYESRSETAIQETSKQYGSYCSTIAMNILRNREDVDECVNDVYMKLWESIPPERPNPFSTYIGRITRNLSIKKAKMKSAGKRGGGEVTLLLSELEQCTPSTLNVESEVDGNDLSRMINSFLSTVNKEDMTYFLCRYWYGDTIPQIAKKWSVGQSKVKMSLSRNRKKLKIYLEERGFNP